MNEHGFYDGMTAPGDIFDPWTMILRWSIHRAQVKHHFHQLAFNVSKLEFIPFPPQLMMNIQCYTR